MPSSRTITLSMPQPDIAVLSLDMPDKGANVLSRSVLDELAEYLDTLEKRIDLAGLVIISGKPGTFIAGADLREFAASLDVSKSEVVAICRRGQALFGRLSACPFITVAAIDGITLGGGTELTLGCDRRIVSDSDKTQIGLPEVKLGLMPGWGGTARMPRIVGLGNAVEMITGGESIDGHAARLMNLASDVVPPDDLLPAAIRLIRAEQQSGAWQEDRVRRTQPITISDTELGFLGATASGYIQQQTRGHYPAPLAALEVLLGSAWFDVESALSMEAEAMADLFGSPVNRALLNVFFLGDRNKKDTGLCGRQSIPHAPREEDITRSVMDTMGAIGSIKTVSVIGAGIMGQGIAAANVRRHIPTALSDAQPEALRRGVENILQEVSYNKKLKGPDAHRVVEFGPLLSATTSEGEIAAASLVIEAIIERADVKQSLYAKLEPLMRPEAILASNTSTIPITTLAEKLKHPQRFAGLHFFNPVRKMPLVEVIRGRQTSDETVATLVAYAKRLGKSPIVVADGPGFLVNRLLLPYMNEAVLLLLEGVSPKAIDRAAKNFGLPMGPLELFDVVGLDTAKHAGHTMHEAFPDRVVDSPLIASLVAAGRLGQKSGTGFFSYRNKRKRAEPDPALEQFVRPLQSKSAASAGGKSQLTDEQITDRLILPMLLEATRVLEDKIAKDARDVDLGLIYGIGFPPFRGGLLFWSDTLGAAAILKRLEPYQALGARYHPTAMLKRLARDGKKFYDE